MSFLTVAGTHGNWKKASATTRRTCKLHTARQHKTNHLFCGCGCTVLRMCTCVYVLALISINISFCGMQILSCDNFELTISFSSSWYPRLYFMFVKLCSLKHSAREYGQEEQERWRHGEGLCCETCSDGLVSATKSSKYKVNETLVSLIRAFSLCFKGLALQKPFILLLWSTEQGAWFGPLHSTNYQRLMELHHGGESSGVLAFSNISVWRK